ncbi:MAG: hypothetical protein WBD31_12325 [Rubripirellula sp.]
MRSLAIPETRQKQITWLESEMLGTQLHRVAIELASLRNLQTYHGDASDQMSFDADTLVRLRDQGLVALSDVQFTSLLTHPRRLNIIQQDVLVNGGPYWSTVDPPHDLNLETRIDRIGAFLREGCDEPPLITPVHSRSDWRSNLGWSTLASLATAACLLIVFANMREPTETAQTPKPVAESKVAVASTIPTSWGFEKFASDIRVDEVNLQPPLDRAAYLRELASAAESWSKKRPETSADLASRIGQFRMGCSAILLADHKPLPDSDRAWLRQRCESWASALDRHLAAIESGRPVIEVRDAVDSTVIKIAAALIGRAETPAT